MFYLGCRNKRCLDRSSLRTEIDHFRGIKNKSLTSPGCLGPKEEFIFVSYTFLLDVYLTALTWSIALHDLSITCVFRNC